MKEVVLKVPNMQYNIIKAIGILISKREEEDNNNKKTSINIYSVSKELGCSQNTARKYLKLLKEL